MERTGEQTKLKTASKILKIMALKTFWKLQQVKQKAKETFLKAGK